MIKQLILPLLLVSSSFFGVSENVQHDDQKASKNSTVIRSEPVENYLPSEQLTVNVTQNNITDCTQFYTFQFSASKELYFSARYKNNCRLVITDPSFVNEEINHAEDGQHPIFDAAVYSLEGNATYPNIVIPSTVNCADYFKLRITEIKPNAILESTKDAISSIIIPDSIETIAADSFNGIAETTEIKTTSASEKAGWASGWNKSKTVNYGYSYSAAERTQANGPYYSSHRSINNGYQFILGYNGEGELNLPLELQYDVVKADHTIETRVSKFPFVSSNYDSVGSPANEDVVPYSISLPIASGESVKDDSLIVKNIYKYDDSNPDKIDLSSGPLACRVATPSKGKHSFDECLVVTPLKLATFAGYTELDVDMETVPGIYEQLKPNLYADYKSQIASGECKIRYRFTNVHQSLFRITYLASDGQKKSVEFCVEPKHDFYNLEKDGHNQVGYLFKNSDIGEDFNAFNLIRVDLIDFFVTFDIFSKETNDTVSAQAPASLKFGEINLYNKELSEKPLTDLNKVLVVILIGSVALFILATIVLFFVYKVAFKNDEFRRLKPKQFFKKAIIYFIGYMFIILSATFIVFRWGFLNTSIIVYNPTDAFVIAFTVAGLISLGLFIKTFVVALRTSKKRRINNKLKLNETTADDGTK